MNRLTRFMLWLIRKRLRIELERISDEKLFTIDNHEDSDCGFQLLHEVEKFK